MTDSMMLLVGLAAIFFAIVIVLATVGVITSERQQVNRSLAAVQAIHAAPTSMQRELIKPFGERVLAPGMARLTKLGKRFSPRDHVSRIRHRLELAGNPPTWDVDRVVAFKMLGLFVGAPARARSAPGAARGSAADAGVRRDLRRDGLLRAQHGAATRRATTGASRCAASCRTHSTC